MRKILLKTATLEKTATLNESDMAAAIWDALPLEGQVSLWGDEAYFSIPIKAEASPGAKAEVQVGDLAYWPPGQAFCIFWGPTPVGEGPEPVAASAVNVFAGIDDNPVEFASIENGEKIVVERKET